MKIANRFLIAMQLDKSTKCPRGSVQFSDTFRLFVCKCYWKTEFSFFHHADHWKAILTN